MMSDSQEPARPRPVISVVVPAYNEAAVLPLFFERLAAVLERLQMPFEVIFVDDGSTDGTPQVIAPLHAADERVKAIHFSRNFGHQAAISAGLDYASGDAVVVIDSDLQDPPEVIVDLINAWQRGGEVVYARRRSRRGETRFKLVTAGIFYRIMGLLMPIPLPKDTGDFRLLDRKAVDTIGSLHEHHRFMRGISAWIGFKQVAVDYDRAERAAGETKYPLLKMVGFSVDAVTSFSNTPLRLATTVGFAMAGVSVFGIIAAVIARLKRGAIRGQGSTIIAVLLLGGMQLIFLGIVGEYLGRVYDEVRGRPLYVIRERVGLR